MSREHNVVVADVRNGGAQLRVPHGETARARTVTRGSAKCKVGWWCVHRRKSRALSWLLTGRSTLGCTLSGFCQDSQCESSWWFRYPCGTSGFGEKWSDDCLHASIGACLLHGRRKREREWSQLPHMWRDPPCAQP